MLLNYLKLALRLLFRNPFFTFINVLGLSVGFSAFFIIGQYAQNELKSDQFHKDWERIVRCGLNVEWTDDKINWQESTWGTNSVQLTNTIAKGYHEVEAHTTVFHQNNFAYSDATMPDHEKEISISVVNQVGETRSFRETRIAYADPNFFDFFTIPLITGDQNSPLNLPESVVLSEKTAKKYFGSANPVGKTLQLNNKISLNVSAVFKDLPRNTHFDFDMLISTERIRNLINNRGFEFYCYVKLKHASDVKTLSARINKDLQENIKFSAWGNWAYGKAQIYFQPLADVAFTSYIQDSHQAKSRFVLSILGYSSIVILAMAWINYVNLSISSSRKRLKEVAARKTVGARPSDILIQFVLESALINSISLLIALTIVQIVRNPVELIFHFYVPAWREVSAQLIIIAGCAFTTGILVTGLYPALVTLKQSPKSLFGSLKARMDNRRFPVSLITFQFTIAIVLIIWIFTVYKQVKFILEMDIGFAKEQVLVVDLPVLRTASFNSEVRSFGSAASADFGSSEYTVSQSVPGDNLQAWMSLRRNEGDAGMQVECNGGVDESFIPFYGIKLLAGRNFLQDHPADSNSVIISEGTAARLGFIDAEHALGESVYIHWNLKAKVIGIIDDYKIRPLLHEGYMNYGGKPGLALTYKNFVLPDARTSIPRKVSFKVPPEKIPESIKAIENRYTKYFPGTLFNWQFLDQLIDGKYKQQKTSRNQIILFAALAVLIACLGLLGMITNKVAEKTREIGIRKVLGARIDQIALLLLRTMILNMIIALIVGVPVASYLAHEYLQTFSRQITLGWWDYAIPSAFLTLIMLATIGSVLWRTARSNPVEALRCE
jgi:putative ABC transport system permease protein